MACYCADDVLLEFMRLFIYYGACGRHVGERAGLLARYGVNKFIVKYPVWFNEDYADYMRHLTFYGRLINTDTVVNLDMEFTENEKVQPGK